MLCTGCASHLNISVITVFGCSSALVVSVFFKYYAFLVSCCAYKICYKAMMPKLCKYLELIVQDEMLYFT